MDRKTQRLSRNTTALAIIDLQERLLPAINHGKQVVENALRLIKGCLLLGVPLLATEQYRKGLGPTVPEIAGAIAGFVPVQKLTFGACAAPGFLDELKAKNISNVLLCGIETHVCICQTALELLEHGYGVFVVVDAVSSRTPENHRIGVQRMRDAGAILVSTEMVLFELLGKAGTDLFKQLLALVK